MALHSRLAAVLVGLVISAIAAPVALDAQNGGSQWDSAIAAFEAADKTSPPPKGEIVFVGSSTIRLWDVAHSFPDLKIINRGFGGSALADSVRYADRIVIPYEPRLVVVYAGDNDISGGMLAEQVAVEFERFVRKVHAKLPQTRILYIAVKPSVLRWTQVYRMRSANEIIRAFCERDDRLAFLDFDSVMLGWDEKPRPELFVADGLHLSTEGYRLWTTIIRPYLVQR